MLFTGRAQGWPDSRHSHGDGFCKWEVTPPTDHLPSQKGARRSAEECQHRRRQSRWYILQKMLGRVSLLASLFIYSLLYYCRKKTIYIAIWFISSLITANLSLKWANYLIISALMKTCDENLPGRMNHASKWPLEPPIKVTWCKFLNQ